MTEDDEARGPHAIPTHAELERAIASVPGVEEARVTLIPETGRSRLRIRLANGEDAPTVSWAIAATLRERFGIALDPGAIRPRLATTDPAEEAAREHPDGPEDTSQVQGVDAEALSEASVVVVGDRVLLSEAARAAISDAIGSEEASSERDAEREDAAGPPASGLDPTLQEVADMLTAERRPHEGLRLVGEEEQAAPLRPVPGAGDEHAEGSEVVGDPEAADDPEAGGASEAVGESEDDGESEAVGDPEAAEDREAVGASEVVGASEAVEGGVDAVSGSSEPEPWSAEVSPAPPPSQRRAWVAKAVAIDTPVEQSGRAAIRHLDTRIDVSDVRVTATLAHGRRAVTGEARSVPTRQGILRAVAEATVAALSELTGDRLIVGVDSVVASVAGDPPMATVLVGVITEHGEETLLGSSLVRADPERAVMRATLDALNRRVEPWLEVDLAG